MLGETKHHLDNQKPDLFLGAQNFLWVICNHFHEDLEYAFKQRNILTLWRYKDLKLDGVNKFFFCREVTVVGHWNQVWMWFHEQSVYVNT